MSSWLPSAKSTQSRTLDLLVVQAVEVPADDEQCPSPMWEKSLVRSLLLAGILEKVVSLFYRTSSLKATDLKAEELAHLLLLCWTAPTGHGLIFFSYPEFCICQGNFHPCFGKLPTFARLYLCPCTKHSFSCL